MDDWDAVLEDDAGRYYAGESEHRFNAAWLAHSLEDHSALRDNPVAQAAALMLGRAVQAIESDSMSTSERNAAVVEALGLTGRSSRQKAAFRTEANIVTCVHTLMAEGVSGNKAKDMVSEATGVGIRQIGRLCSKWKGKDMKVPVPGERLLSNLRKQ